MSGIEVLKDKCIGCSLCSKICPQGAIEMKDNKAEMRSEVPGEGYCESGSHAGQSLRVGCVSPEGLPGRVGGH